MLRRALLGGAGMVLAIAMSARAGPVLPAFSPADFVAGAPIDNPFFPLTPGTTFHYAAEITDPDSGEKGFERDDDAVTFQTKTIAGVVARVVRARTWLEDVLIEDTLDYYAQDKSGNVWYLGEDTKAFEYDDEGKLINTDTAGSFRAGVNGAKAGFIMPANPQIGFNYYQEFAPNDQALDQATILSRTESITLPLGSFNNVLKTLETTELEPDVIENKFYAAGVGNILTWEDIDESGEPLNILPLVSIERAAAVPLPPAVWSGLAVLCASAVCQTLKIRRGRQVR
jgi:hypothetical protein